MAKSAILAVRIIGDSSGATRAMSSTASSASGLAAKFGAVSGLVSGVVSSMASSVIGHVKSLAGEMAATSDSAQSFANTLKFAGVDDSKIQTLTKSTQKYADQTVFSLSDIRNTTAQLAANGVQGYDQLAEAAGNLTAVAGGGADAYKSVAMVLTQTAGAGKLTTENWNQLSDAIPGASGKLQAAMAANGAYTGNFRDAMAKGQISADEFNQALLQLGMSDAAKKAANDTSQLGNASGNLDAGIVKLGSSFLNLVKPQLTDFMAKLADKVSDLADKVPQMPQQLAQWAGKLGEVANNIAPVVIGIGGFAAGLTLLYSVMSAGGILQWVSSLSAVTSVTKTWTTVTNLAKDAQAAFNLVLETNPIMVVITLVVALVAALAWFFTQTQTGQQMWSSFTSFLGSSITNIRAWFGQAGDWITAKWQGVQAFFSGLPGAIGGFFSGIGQWLSQPFINAGNWAQSKWDGVKTWFSGLPGAIGGFFSNAGSILWNAGSSIIEGLWNGLKQKWEDVKNWFGGLGDWIQQHKGPPSYDAVLLTRNGNLIMKGFQQGLEQGWNRQVRPYLGDVTRELPRFSVSSLGNSGVMPMRAGNVYNLTFNGVIDADDAAKRIQKMLDGRRELRR